MSKNHQRLLGLLLALFAAVPPQLLSAQTLCDSATGGGAASDISWGGNGSGHEAGSRRGDFWDEEE